MESVGIEIHFAATTGTHCFGLKVTLPMGFQNQGQDVILRLSTYAVRTILLSHGGLYVEFIDFKPIPLLTQAHIYWLFCNDYTYGRFAVNIGPILLLSDVFLTN